MTQLIEQYIDSLMRDPHALPPNNMDAGTAAFVRATLAITNAKPTSAARARMWQRALEAAMTTNGTQNYVTSLPTSANGHHANNHRIISVERTSIPPHHLVKAPIAARFRGILTLAAAFVLVLFGIVLLAMIGTSGTTPNTSSGQQQSGSATPTETATTQASDTPMPSPTIVPASTEIRDVVEYTIRPGDTLMAIIQSPPFNYNDPRIVETIIALNPNLDISQIPPGTTVLIPLPTPEPTSAATIPGTRLPSNLASIMSDLQSLPGNPDAGQAIFETAVCSACHDNSSISTLTESIWQSAETTIQRLPQFSGYTAEMYIIESIILPSAYVVPGYANLMPETYRENLTLQQLADLIAYLRSFALPQRAQSATVIAATVTPPLSIVVQSLDLSATAVPQATAVEPIHLTATQIVRQATGAAAREGTSTAVAVRLTPTATPSTVTTYVIQEGDTLLEVALRFDTTLQTLAELNPQIDFSSCDFTRMSGGSNCVIRLMMGDMLNVPLYDETTGTEQMMATPTPIPSSIFSLPTATPMPTATAA